MRTALNPMAAWPFPTNLIKPAVFMDNYFPGSMCRVDRCEFYRRKDSEGESWCWLRHGIGAEGREAECPAYIRGLQKKPNENSTPKVGSNKDDL